MRSDEHTWDLRDTFLTAIEQHTRWVIEDLCDHVLSPHEEYLTAHLPLLNPFPGEHGERRTWLECFHGHHAYWARLVEEETDAAAALRRSIREWQERFQLNADWLANHAMRDLFSRCLHLDTGCDRQRWSARITFSFGLDHFGSVPPLFRREFTVGWDVGRSETRAQARKRIKKAFTDWRKGFDSDLDGYLDHMESLIAAEAIVKKPPGKAIPVQELAKWAALKRCGRKGSEAHSRDSSSGYGLTYRQLAEQINKGSENERDEEWFRKRLPEFIRAIGLK